MITLTPRLKAIVSQIDSVKCAIDVGCDHAQVGIALVEQGKVQHMTVSDINEGPISSARRAVLQAGLCDKISCIKCDGLDGIEPQDAVIIAGMGGELIADILLRAPWTKENCLLVLQPMTAGDDLRKFLFENGYAILKEIIVREREKLYTIITVCGGEMKLCSDADLYLYDTSHPLAAEYLDKCIARVEKMLSGKQKGENPDAAELVYLERLVSDLREKRAKCN